MDGTALLVKIGAYVLGFFAIIAAIVWFTQVHPVMAGSTNTLPPSVSLSASSTQSGAATLPNFDGTGIVIIDESGGSPGTPYLVYETTKGKVGIKELLFLQPGEEPCQISAGEYPCAPTNAGDDSADSDASPVPSGTAVHLVGGVTDQAIIVQSISTLSQLPSGVVEFSTPFEGTSTLSNGLVLQPTQVIADQSCTLFVGCYGPNTPRVVTKISVNNNEVTTTELVPGTIFTYGNSTIILLSVSSSGSSTLDTANFLVVSY